MPDKLGLVLKRIQLQRHSVLLAAEKPIKCPPASAGPKRKKKLLYSNLLCVITDGPYTHLTLPTLCSIVFSLVGAALI